MDGTGLYYYGARFYDPTLGRFINIDPAKDGANWWVYVNNNPLRYVDLTGLIAEESIWWNPWTWDWSWFNSKDFKTDTGYALYDEQRTPGLFSHPDRNEQVLYVDNDNSDLSISLGAGLFRGDSKNNSLGLESNVHAGDVSLFVGLDRERKKYGFDVSASAVSYEFHKVIFYSNISFGIKAYGLSGGVTAVIDHSNPEYDEFKFGGSKIIGANIVIRIYRK